MKTVNKRILIYAVLVLFSLAGFFVYQGIKFNDGKLHVIFCDVGQGDGILLITPAHKHILLDAGPDKSILTCLSNHLPFWGRTIDLMILSHPHLDHFYGMGYVIDSYDVKAFATEDLANKASVFQVFLQSIKSHNIPTQYVLAGDKWGLGKGITLSVLAPDEAFLHETSPGGTIGEKSEFASVITRLSYGKFSTVFTGDSQARELAEATAGIGSISVLQIPHHGSRTGTSDEILKSLTPALAVISVGAHNRYGHPTKFTLDLLEENNIKTLRTDRNGDGEIVTDGNEMSIKTGKNQ